MTYHDVDSVYADLYAHLREATGENAPSSWTWVAPTRAEVCHDSGVKPRRADVQVGGGPAVAWSFEVGGRTLARIGRNATPVEIRQHLRDCMGI